MSFEEYVDFHVERKHLEFLPDGCWLWKGAKYQNGYGVGWFYKAMPAHRAFYIKKYGDIGKDDIHHEKCKLRLCVNPDHMTHMPHPEHRRLHKKGLTSSPDCVILGQL